MKRHSPWLYGVSLLVLTFALYQKSWSNPFVLDDWTKIQENSDLRIPFQLENFVYPYANPLMHFRNDPSRPLTFMIYWACWQIGEGSSVPFHIVNTAIHALVALLLMWFTAALCFELFAAWSWPAGAFAAALFITSPLIAGTVIYAYGLSDLLGSLFSLCTLVSLLRRPDAPWGRLLLSATFFILALAAKQSAIVLPALLMAMDYFTGKRRAKAYWVLGSVALGYLGMRMAYFGGIGDLEAHDQLLPALTYARTQGLVILRYLLMSFMPWGLTIDHRVLPEDIPAWLGFSSWALIFLLSFLALRARRRAGAYRLLAFGWAFFLFSLLPTSSVVPTVDLMVERRAYLADIGVFMVVGGLLWRFILRRPQWRPAILTTMLIALAAQTALALERTHIYGEPERLWGEAMTRDPDNPRAALNLAVYYSFVGRWEESRMVLEALIRAQPENGALYSKLAYIYEQKTYAKHNSDLAWENYQRALTLMPDNIFAIYNAGTLALERGHADVAEHYFLRATELNPQMAQAFLAAGQAALIQGKKSVAADDVRKALSLDSHLVEARRLLEQIEH